MDQISPENSSSLLFFTLTLLSLLWALDRLLCFPQEVKKLHDNLHVSTRGRQCGSHRWNKDTWSEARSCFVWLWIQTVQLCGRFHRPGFTPSAWVLTGDKRPVSGGRNTTVKDQLSRNVQSLTGLSRFLENLKLYLRQMRPLVCLWLSDLSWSAPFEPGGPWSKISDSESPKHLICSTDPVINIRHSCKTQCWHFCLICVSSNQSCTQFCPTLN